MKPPSCSERSCLCCNPGHTPLRTWEPELGGMERLVFSLTLLVTCLALRQDLTGKVFTFPLESDTTHVKLVADKAKNLLTVTVCLRYFSDLRRSQSLFSLATPSSDNGFLFFKPELGVYNMYVLGSEATFWGLPDRLSEWVSLCGTWDSDTGLAQLWVDGKPSSRKALKPGGTISTPHSIVLGQEQDSYGGSFDKGQSFVGLITDVHMWDHVLPPLDIHLFAEGSTFAPGNVLEWGDMEYTRQGQVIVEDKQSPVWQTEISKKH
ncbi:serum amyloid P-component-like [Arapaima gigas]